MINKFIHHPEKLRPYLLAGNMTFTLVSRKLNKRYTYHITQDKKNKQRYLVSVMYGDNNTDYKNSYHYLGLFYDDTFQLRMTNQSYNKQHTDAARMLDYFLEIVDQRKPWPDTCEFYASTKCARCGRNRKQSCQNRQTSFKKKRNKKR